MRAVSVLSEDPVPAMVRVVLAPHPLLLVTVVVAVCAAIPHAVMAIDLSRLYGHISSKRSGKTHYPAVTSFPQRSINTAPTSSYTTKLIEIDYMRPCPSYANKHL